MTVAATVGPGQIGPVIGCWFAEPEQRHKRAVSGVGPRDFVLDAQQAGFNGGRPPQPPQQARKPQDPFAFDRGLRVVIRGNRLLERLIVRGILERFDDGLSGEPMAQRISGGALFAVFAPRTSAVERGAAIGLDLFNRRHRRPELASFRIWRPLWRFAGLIDRLVL
jgi:hypothetical protein